MLYHRCRYWCRSGQRAGPNLRHAARAADHSAKGHCVAPIEGQGPIVGDIPGDASGRSTVTELECSCTDRCAAGVSIVAGQGRRAGPNLSDTARAADHSGKRHCIAPIEG